MSKIIEFEQQNAHGAAIDIGAKKIFVSWDGTTTESYFTFTEDYRRCISDLKEHHVERVCMEATGVYWIALHQMLEQAGFQVCLVNPKEVKQVKGRKTDVKDCCWMQKVFSAGLIRQSYVPAGKLKELRMLVREREDIISMGSTYVNKMQKALELMNIKLKEVLSQIHGISGIKIIEAILKGERNVERLLALCDNRIISKKADQVIKALEGNYNDSWLFLLEQNLKMWKIHQEHLSGIDQRIELILDQLGQIKLPVASEYPAKPIRHHKPQIDQLHQKLLTIYGADANCLPGINDYTLLRLLGEVGSDMSRFPSAKHFVSWCQLSPGHNQSGSRTKRVRIRNGSRTGEIFREAAYSLITSKYLAIGAFMRRLRARKDSKTAIKAGARKIAIAFYNLRTKGALYVEQGAALYQEQLKLREKSFLKKLARKHGLQLVENQLIT
jgi:transposase